MHEGDIHGDVDELECCALDYNWHCLKEAELSRMSFMANHRGLNVLNVLDFCNVTVSKPSVTSITTSTLSSDGPSEARASHREAPGQAHWLQARRFTLSDCGVLLCGGAVILGLHASSWVFPPPETPPSSTTSSTTVLCLAACAGCDIGLG